VLAISFDRCRSQILFHRRMTKQLVLLPESKYRNLCTVTETCTSCASCAKNAPVHIRISTASGKQSQRPWNSKTLRRNQNRCYRRALDHKGKAQHSRDPQSAFLEPEEVMVVGGPIPILKSLRQSTWNEKLFRFYAPEFRAGDNATYYINSLNELGKLL